jgi:hypothetical protein
MTPVRIPKRIAITICSLTAMVFFFNRCIDNNKPPTAVVKNLKGKTFAGSASCRSCHQAISDSFVTTTHYLTSTEASLETVKGSFIDGNNTFILDSAWKVIMEKRGDGLYQTAYLNGIKDRSERFDIVIGSGKRGQSYLHWLHNELYQLPVSYFAKHDTWVNSPGFTTRKIYFDRVIEARCLECHTTFANERFTNEYNRTQLILGIDCEKCHGPAADHVAFHTENPTEKQAKFIINTSTLTRQQQLDACAVCHSGTIRGFSRAFSFTPGDTLSKFFSLNTVRADTGKLDVHANQYGLLASSQCFIMSKTMQCGTCHDPHVKESGNLSVYDQKCMGCHTTENHNTCTRKPEHSLLMAENCVNCHMPVKESGNIMVLTSGKAVPSSQPIRTHLIAVYPEQSKK